MHVDRIIHIEGVLAEENFQTDCEMCGDGTVERHVIYHQGGQFSHSNQCSICNWEKWYPHQKAYEKALDSLRKFTSGKRDVYDGYTPEGYAYTLTGTDPKHIKQLFRSKDLEVYMYDFWKPCQFCDTRHKEHRNSKPEGAEDRIYVVIRGHIHPMDKDTEYAEVFMWSNTQLFCPKCFVDLNDMFVGLESNDP